IDRQNVRQDICVCVPDVCFRSLLAHCNRLFVSFSFVSRLTYFYLFFHLPHGLLHVPPPFHFQPQLDNCDFISHVCCFSLSLSQSLGRRPAVSAFFSCLHYTFCFGF